MPQMQTTTLTSQVSRPVAVQMARSQSQAKLEGQQFRIADGRAALEDSSQLSLLSLEQLVLLCYSLHGQSESNKQQLAEHVKEQGKLLKERELLRGRKAELERTLEGRDVLSSSRFEASQILIDGSAGCAPALTETPAALVAEFAEKGVLQTKITNAEIGHNSEEPAKTSPKQATLVEVLPVGCHDRSENMLASPAQPQLRPEAAVFSPSKIVTTSPKLPEEVSLASPIRPLNGPIQPIAVSLDSPKVVPNAEIVTLASPMPLEILESQANLQPDVVSGRPVTSPGSADEIVKVLEVTSPETPSATTLVAESLSDDSGKVDGLPCSGDAAAGVGAKSDEIKMLSPSYGSLDGSSVLPDCETMAQEKITEVKQHFPSVPEELMARVEDSSIRLTWFFDEEMLEQLVGPGELKFEIRQQSEGVGGRLRIRQHECDAIYSAKDGAVQEQNFLVEHCAAGRPYTFSIRARSRLPGAEAQVSDFCEAVTACLPVAVAVPKAPVSLCSTATSVASKGGLEEVAPIATIPTAMVSSPSNQATMPAKTVPLLIPAIQPQCVAPAPEPDTQERVQLLPCLTQPASPRVDATPMEVEQPVDPAVHAPEPQASVLPVRHVVPKVAEAEVIRPIEVKSGLEARSRFLPDDGCNLRKWLLDHKRESREVRPEATNGVQAEAVSNGLEDQSFLRQWLQSRQALNSNTKPAGQTLQGQMAVRMPTEIDVTRLPEETRLPGESRYDEMQASVRLQPMPAEDVRQVPVLGAPQPGSLQVPDFRQSSYAPFSTQGDLRQPINIIGNARSKSFGGVERRQTMIPKLESRHADLSPGRGAGDGIRIVTAMTPNGHGLVAPLPAHLSRGGLGLTPQAPAPTAPTAPAAADPVTLGNALTTINSLPQPSWTHGHQVADPLQTHGLNQQVFFGQPPITPSNFFTPLNDNLFGASSALGSTRPFSHFPQGALGADAIFKPAMSAFPEEAVRHFEPPPPPRSAPSLQYGDEARRESMPWDEGRQGCQGCQGGHPGFGVTQNVAPVEIRRKSELQVRMSDHKWESLRFSSSDDLELQGQQFVSRCGLKSAFLPGLVARLKQMVAIQQDYACVDVVDLI